MNSTMFARIENCYLQPPEDDRKVCCECSVCGEDIKEGDDCYELLGMTICQSCIDDAHGYAELDEAI